MNWGRAFKFQNWPITRLPIITPFPRPILKFKRPTPEENTYGETEARTDLDRQRESASIGAAHPAGRGGEVVSRPASRDRARPFRHPSPASTTRMQSSLVSCWSLRAFSFERRAVRGWSCQDRHDSNCLEPISSRSGLQPIVNPWERDSIAELPPFKRWFPQGWRVSELTMLAPDKPTRGPSTCRKHLKSCG